MYFSNSEAAFHFNQATFGADRASNVYKNGVVTNQPNSLRSLVLIRAY